MRHLAVALALAACAPVGFRDAEWRGEPIEEGRLQWRVRDGRGHGPGLGAWSARHVRPRDGGFELRLRRGVGAEISAALPLGALDVDLTLESLDAPFEALGPEVVVGAFVYRHDTSEADLEIARWGDRRSANGQLVVAAGPFRPPRAIVRFPLEGPRVEAALRWRGGRLAWRVTDGQRPLRWSARGPRNAGHRLHVNVWARRPGAGEARIWVRARARASASMEPWPTSGT
ncbi:MAG: hypothetical protein AAGH15_07115 [Myxococcota bacterium]